MLALITGELHPNQQKRKRQYAYNPITSFTTLPLLPPPTPLLSPGPLSFVTSACLTSFPLTFPWSLYHNQVVDRCPNLTELLVSAGIFLRRQKHIQQGVRVGLSPGRRQRCSAAADPPLDQTLHGLAHLEHVGDGASAHRLQRTSET